MKQLTEDLKTGNYKKVYLLFGEEAYLISFYAERLIDKNVPPEDRFMNLQILNEGAASADAIEESVNCPPFMGNRRVTLVKYSGYFSGSKKGEDASSEKLIALLKNLPDFSLLIFVENQVDKRTALYKAIQKNGYAAQLDEPAESDLMTFMARRLASVNKKIGVDTARFFLEQVGHDMQCILQELEKVIALSGERSEILRSDVETICITQPENNIFKLTDALGSRNRRAALACYERLLESNESPQRIFYLIASQFRKLLRVKVAETLSVPEEEKAGFAGVVPKALWIYSKQARGFSLAQLEEFIMTLTQMDLQMKTSQIKAEDACLQLISSYS